MHKVIFGNDWDEVLKEEFENPIIVSYVNF